MIRTALTDGYITDTWTKLSNRWDIQNKLSDVWGIGKHYWYPLTESNKEDLISFESSYIINKEKLSNIKSILLQMGVTEIYEFRENGLLYKIQKINDYNFWDSDDYFWNNECFWFNDAMDFIIYISHEETLTFGGEIIIKELKNYWHDWNEHLKWDTKNK